MKKIGKLIAVLAVAAFVMTRMTGVAFAATDLMKDGKIANGFINAGEEANGAVSGPGNWTQLNLGDAAVDANYLHIVMNASGDTKAAQIVVSDTATYNLSDLGVTLTEEYQDVVLPLEGKNLSILSWVNFTGLDGGSSVYQIKDIFLSEDAAPTVGAATVEEPAAETASDDVPKTGDSMVSVVIAAIVLAGACTMLVWNKKLAKVK